MMKARGTHKLLMAALLVVCLSFSNFASAGCKQKKLAGTWEGQAFVMNNVTNQGNWISCKFKVNSKGFYNPNTSVCVYDNGVNVFPGGRFKLRSSCVIDNSFFDLWDVNGAYIGFSVLEYGTVDKGQTVMQSVGDSGTTTPFIFNAVKR